MVSRDSADANDSFAAWSASPDWVDWEWRGLRLCGGEKRRWLACRGERKERSGEGRAERMSLTEYRVREGVKETANNV